MLFRNSAAVAGSDFRAVAGVAPSPAAEREGST